MAMQPRFQTFVGEEIACGEVASDDITYWLDGGNAKIAIEEASEEGTRSRISIESGRPDRRPRLTVERDGGELVLTVDFIEAREPVVRIALAAHPLGRQDGNDRSTEARRLPDEAADATDPRSSAAVRAVADVIEMSGWRSRPNFVATSDELVAEPEHSIIMYARVEGDRFVTGELDGPTGDVSHVPLFTSAASAVADIVNARSSWGGDVGEDVVEVEVVVRRVAVRAAEIDRIVDRDADADAAVPRARPRRRQGAASPARSDGSTCRAAARR